MGAGAAPDVLMRFLVPFLNAVIGNQWLVPSRTEFLPPVIPDPWLSSRSPRLSFRGCLLLTRFSLHLQAFGRQQLAHFEQHHQPSCNLGQPDDTVQAAFLKNSWRSLHGVRWNLQYFRGRIHDQPSQPASMLDD